MATAPTYCTQRQLKDVFPQVSEFDTKKALYGWTLGLTDFDSTLDIYYADNVGLVTVLFWDGGEVKGHKFPPAATTTVNGAKDADATFIDFTSASAFEVGDIIKIGDEYLDITTINTNRVTVSRGMFGTTAVDHADDASIYLAYDLSDGSGSDGTSDAPSFVYDSDMDKILLIVDSKNPNDYLVEAGEDYSTLITRVMANASRYLDAKLDPNLPKEQLKDKEGNFDYIIVRTTALITATFMIRAHDPTSEVANALMEEAQGNIDALNKGGAALSWQTTGDSSKGIIRDVSYTSGSVRPVDTRGRWSGSFDLIRVIIVAGGALDGTATYSVWVKDGDKLGNQQGNQVVTAEKINGDYQSLAGGLQIRFGGSTKTSVATATNEWEIEVAGWQEEVDNSAINSVRMTRR